MARGSCGDWDPLLRSIYLYAHGAITLAYLAIPLILLIAMLSKRRDTSALRPEESQLARICYGSFVLACGIGHLEGPLSFWWPSYHLFTLWHVTTAAISWWAVLVTFHLRVKIITGV
jgi:hypothetical protein